MLCRDIVYYAFFVSLMNIYCHDTSFLKAFLDTYKNHLYQICHNNVRVPVYGIQYPFAVHSFLSAKHQFKEKKKLKEKNNETFSMSHRCY